MKELLTKENILPALGGIVSGIVFIASIRPLCELIVHFFG